MSELTGVRERQGILDGAGERNESMKIKIIFVYDTQLNEDGVSAYMDEDTTFGVAVYRVCGALGMRLAEWSFFFGPYELEAETSRLRRDLRERSEYGLHRERGGRDRGGRDRERERDGNRGWDAERNGGEALEAGPRQPRCLRRRVAAWRAAKP
jgi:hypothetical protein